MASRVGACLLKEKIPVHPLLDKYLGEDAVDLALTGGDDYELCFTVPDHLYDSFMKEQKQLSNPCYPIGEIQEAHGLRIKSIENVCTELKPEGYSHFS